MHSLEGARGDVREIRPGNVDGLQIVHFREIELELGEAAVLNGQGAETGHLLKLLKGIEAIVGPAAKEHFQRGLVAAGFAGRK